MKKLAILLGAVALTVAPCANAFADDFTFSFSSTVLNASGTFTGAQDPSAPAGVYLATSIDGTAWIGGTSYSITGMVPVFTYLGNDNDYYSEPAATIYNDGLPFDFNGFAFSLSNGDYMTLWQNNGSDAAFAGTADNPEAYFSNGTAAVAFTPEPESLTLLGTGVLALAGLVRRRIVA